MSDLVNGKSRRRELGLLLEKCRVDLNMTRHSVADKARSSSANVERWERGDLCPSSQEFSRLRVVFPKLTAQMFKDLFNGAALEQLSEQNGSGQDAVTAAPDLDAAVTLMLDAVPTLRSMSIEVDDQGDVHVAYKTREVRVVEDGGQLSITRRRA